MGLFKKKDENILKPELAGQMLQNVFDVCEVEPNSVPLNELESYSNYRRDRFQIQKIVLTIIMLLFLLIPFFFIGPKIDVLDQTEYSPSPVYHLDVDSLLPITSVTATVDGQHVPVYEVEKKVYSIEPDVGGEMIIVVTSVNHQYTATKVQVSTIDREPPEMLDNQIKDDLIYLYLKDEGDGIDYPAVYAKNKDGKELKPVKYDEQKGYVAFKCPKSSINVYVPDKAENVLQLVLTI